MADLAELGRLERLERLLLQQSQELPGALWAYYAMTAADQA
jgi:hypothetical protein